MKTGENNKIIAEFMDRTIFAYNGNSSFNQEFHTFRDCEEWIKENDFKGYKAQLGWGNISGKYNIEWNELMPVFVKCCGDLGIKRWSKSNRIYHQLGVQDFKDIKYVYGVIVEFIKWHNKQEK